MITCERIITVLREARRFLALNCWYLLKLIQREPASQRQQSEVVGPCRFAKLPTEIRLMIFRLILHQGTIQMSMQTTGYLFCKEVRMVSQAHGQVLRVCKLFEREGTSILYGDNAIRIRGEDLVSFDQQVLQTIGKKNLALLRRIEIDELRESCPDRFASTLSTVARHNPELRKLQSLVLLAADSRFPKERDQGEADAGYIGGPTGILPHLTKLIINGNNVTLAVGRTDAANGVRPHSPPPDDLMLRLTRYPPESYRVFRCISRSVS